MKLLPQQKYIIANFTFLIQNTTDKSLCFVEPNKKFTFSECATRSFACLLYSKVILWYCVTMKDKDKPTV